MTSSPDRPADDSRRIDRQSLPARHSPTLLGCTALLTAGAAAIHFAVVPEHLDEYLPFGVFFAVLGVAQLGLAATVLFRPGRRVGWAGLAGTVGVLGLWLWSRTVGLPIGPEPGQPEAVGVPDAVCLVLEVVGLPLFARLAMARPRPRRRRIALTTLAVAPVALVVTALTVVGTGTGLAAMPVAVDAAAPVPGQPSTSVTSLVAAPGTEPVRTFTLVAEPGTVNGQPADTFNGTVPGPELRVTQDDRVHVRLVNHLPVATTLHWHGVRVPDAEDGVAGLTQDAVRPGQSYDYDFVATDPGTYWYHSHQDTGAQIPAGLFGALTVEPPGGRTAEDVDAAVLLHNLPGTRTTALNGTTGTAHLAARPGQTVRLRITDAVAPNMDGTAQAPVLLGAPYRIVALDAHDLHAPQALGLQRIPLGMGQRADLVFTMPPAGSVRLVDTQIQGAPSALQRFFGTVTSTDTLTVGDGPAPDPAAATTAPVFDATGYGTPQPDPVAETPAVTYPVVLAEGPGFHDGAVQLVHTINGAASPDVPPLTVHTGQLVRLRFDNRTGEFHPMHLHGHVFSVLAVDGRAPQGSPLHLDTVLVGPHQTVDVAFLADNPGLWMLHCHVLLHASMGMSMTIAYAGYSTPFTMGSRSGNTPE